MPEHVRDILYNAVKYDAGKSIIFVNNKSGNKSLNYADLLKEAEKISAALLTGLNGKNKLIIAVNNNFERIKLLWGCFLAGIVPTIVKLPARGKADKLQYDKLIGIFHTLEAPFVAVSNPDFDSWNNDEIIGKYVLSFDEIKNTKSYTQSGDIENEIAYIQFSSGSTGNPKGVVLTHENIISNLEAIKKGINVTGEDTSFNWMPLYHDMGLIGFHLSSVFNCVNQYILDTNDFIRNPFIWLDYISNKKVTITGCPNFGQNLILRRLEHKADSSWDLSSLRVLLNGAEPISHKIMKNFTDRLAKYKLNPSAMFPVYGLAEATLAVTFPDYNSEPVVSSFNSRELFSNKKAVEYTKPSAIKYVSVGKPVSNCQLRIVNDEMKELKENTSGHIQVKGKNITRGYFGSNNKSDELFTDGWLNTGDVGFIYKNNLYVIGRDKDTIIVNGKNYNSADLEKIAKALLKNENIKLYIIPSEGENGRDKILLFIAGMNNESAVKAYFRINQFFSRYAAIGIDELITVPSTEIQKTSSGKIKRFKLRENYESGKYNEVIKNIRIVIYSEEEKSIKNKISPSTTTEIILHKLWCKQLVRKAGEIGTNDNFYDLGGASIDVVDIIIELKRSYDISINSADFYRNITIKDLANYIDNNTVFRPGEKLTKKKFRG